jgi:hypothetical protein
MQLKITFILTIIVDEPSVSDDEPSMIAYQPAFTQTPGVCCPRSAARAA